MISQIFEKFNKENGGTISQISKDTGLHLTYVSKSLSGWGDFKLSDEKKAEVDSKIKDYLNSKITDNKSSPYGEIIRGAGYLEFENTQNIIASIIKAGKQKSLMKISAASGTGKTTAVKIISQKLPQMVVITAYKGMNSREFLEDFCIGIGMKNIPKTTKEMMRETKKYLQNVKKIVAIDEANFLNEKSLEQIRHIHDVCEIGIVLVGTEVLDIIIAKSHPQVATRIRNGLEVKKFGLDEVKMMCKKYNIFTTNFEDIYKAKRNLRDVEYFLQDYIEVYGTDEGNIKEGLKRF